MLRCIPIAILLLAALWGDSGAQTTLRLPSGSSLYADLEHFRALGLWRGSLEARPISRGELCQAVDSILTRAHELSGADLPRLERLRDFCEEHGGGGLLSRIGRKLGGEVAGAGVGAPPACWEPGLGIQFYGVQTGLDSLADLDRRPRRDGLFFLSLDAEIAGQFSAQIRFYEDYSRLSPRPGSGDWVDNLPPDAGSLNKDPSARLDRAVLAYCGGWWEVRLGREDRRMGAGRRGSLFLSENPFPLDGLSFLFHTRYVSGTTLFAQSQRGSRTQIGTRTQLASDVRQPEDEPPVSSVSGGEAFVAAHRFEIRPPGPLSLGLFEAVAYGGRGIDLAYANPLGFFTAMTQDLADRSDVDDKKELGLDLRLDLPPFTFYGEFLLDRLVVLDAAQDGEESGISSFGQLAGLSWADPLGLAGADIDLEYSHLDPQVYFHWDGDLRRAFLTDDRLGEGRLIGHWLGPNADGLYARFVPPPSRRWGAVELEFEQARWGLIDGLRGVDAGFVGLTKAEKRWITGEKAVERLFTLSWQRLLIGERRAGGVTLDVRASLARVERSGAWEGEGWQAQFRLLGRWDASWRE